MSARYSSRVGMRPSLEQTAASSALPKNTLVFLPKRLGKLRVLVLMTVAPSRTCAWLPMHRLQPGISVRAPAVPKNGVQTFFSELVLVHFGGGRYPEFDGDVALAFE